MAEPKTRPTTVTLEQFLAKVTPAKRRQEALVLDEIFRRVTGHPPVMWGPSIVGYDQYQSPTGLWPAAGFSPRKAALTLYVMDGSATQAGDLARLGKHKSSVACLYINKLEDVDLTVLEKIISNSYARVKKELDQKGK